MRPTRDIVVVKFMKQENTTSAGIILQSSTDTRVGHVLGIGPRCNDVKLHDKIVADWSKGYDVGKGLLCIEEQYVQGIVEE